MKILFIGNSFSKDAMCYLHKLAKGQGVDIKTENLYIGGCSLEIHCHNILEKNYLFEVNGETTGLFVSIKEALMSDGWDYITIQQVSSLSDKYESYQPYLNKVTEYVKKVVLSSKLSFIRPGRMKWNLNV